ncbi:Protein of unknown function [Halobiforma haloterrestris]|uniref:DUF429 domain-containing protein n=2 Tax=Natronobacterium haloterrestre TaxID=148448 RepID=A0A1I1JVI0_NATHA|nr:Protein of unknown function [Halobiforma haloterrestris]
MHPSIHSVWFEHRDADAILVDVPIGLPADHRRTCDREAKDLLGPDRANSVFWTPCREAVEATVCRAKRRDSFRGFRKSIGCSEMPRPRGKRSSIDIHPPLKGWASPRYLSVRRRYCRDPARRNRSGHAASGLLSRSPRRECRTGSHDIERPGPPVDRRGFFDARVVCSEEIRSTAAESFGAAACTRSPPPEADRCAAYRSARDREPNSSVRSRSLTTARSSVLASTAPGFAATR